MCGYQWHAKRVCEQGRDDGKNDVRSTYGDVTTPRPPAIDDIYPSVRTRPSTVCMAPRLDIYTRSKKQLHESTKISLSYSIEGFMQSMPPVSYSRGGIMQTINIQPLHYLHGKDLCKIQKSIYLTIFVIDYESHHHMQVYCLGMFHILSVLHKSFPSTYFSYPSSRQVSTLRVSHKSFL